MKQELYEPLWEDLHARSKSNGFRIRSIWIADVAQQGQSGVLNEQHLGNDRKYPSSHSPRNDSEYFPASWSDHPRDLLHMVNHFRAQMPLPIVGIGHSFGGATLVNLSLIHPRLFTTLVLLDPVIQVYASSPAGPSPAQASTFRRDLWPSRAEAEAGFRKSKFYQTWDPRVLDIWCKYGIRETPTNLFPEEKGSVTLTTTKHQECFTFLRPSWEAFSEDGTTIVRRDLVPELREDSPAKFPYYRAEPYNTLVKLPEVRPSVLYILGAESDMSTPDARKMKMEMTGAGVGGSGGAKEGRVKEVVLEGVGHLVAMEASEKCADFAAAWLGPELKKFEVKQREYVEWTKQNLVERTTLSKEWERRIGGPLRKPKSQM